MRTYHVIRPANCSVAAIQAALNTVAAEGGKLEAVAAHNSTAGGSSGANHDQRWCVLDIFYSKGND